MAPMTDRRTMAIGIGALLLLVNLGLMATGFVDGQIESTVESAVSDGMDGIDDDGNEDYTFDYDAVSYTHLTLPTRS